MQAPRRDPRVTQPRRRHRRRGEYRAETSSLPGSSVSEPLTTSVPLDVPLGGVWSTLRRRPLVAYFALAFGLSWLVFLPEILAAWNVVPPGSHAGAVLKQWVGPGLAGLLMAYAVGGRPGRSALRARVRRWRVGWGWYAVALVLAPLVVLVSVVAVVGLPAAVPTVPPTILVSYLVYLVLVFFGVGLPEEIGWRGFALDRLQNRYGPLVGTLVLGVLWALWHLPYFLTSDHGGGPGAAWGAVWTNFAIFSGMVIALSVPMTFVFNRTGGSVLLVALMHASIDTAQLVWLPLLLPVGAETSTTGERQLDLAALVGFGVTALLLVLFTRGRLGRASRRDALDLSPERTPI